MKKIILILLFAFMQASYSQWEACNNGLFDGTIKCIAINGNYIFAGTFGGGVYLSTDNGDSWTAKNSGLTNYSIRSIALSETNIIAGTQGGGVFLSTDNGDSWTAKNSGLTNLTVGTIAIIGKNIFIGTQKGIFHSTDNCDSWVSRNSGLSDLFITSLVISGNNIFAGIGFNVFLSTDIGNSWIKKFTATRKNSFVRTLAANGNKCVVGLIGGGVFLSTDNGDNWTEKNSVFTTYDVYSLALSGNNIFAGLNESVYLSTNNGKNWALRNLGLTNNSIHSFSISGNTIFATPYYSGIFRAKLSDFISSFEEEKPSENIIDISPNPFDKSTRINFNLNKAEYVKLDIYNSLGLKITTLIDEFRDAGNHSSNFDAAGLPQGLYYYSLRIGKRTEFGKLVLIR